ncbi:TnpV protein [Agathobaculum sp.]|uniref:TnpV protein n=1 Tax=Agathobaculum sp. TaxID=2048138 RepID=UPI001899AF30
MDKYIYDEKNGLWYELQGDYYLPCLKLPEKVEVHIGVWGQHHRRYLKEHRKTAYTRLLTSGKLNSYLNDIDQQAKKLFSELVSQMTAAEGVTEAFKVADQMEWIRRTNSIRNRAGELVESELIYN